MLRHFRWGVLFVGAALVARADFDARPLVTIYSSEDLGQDAMSWAAVEDREHCLHFGANSLLSFNGSQWRSDAAGSAYALRGLDVDEAGHILLAAAGELGWFDPAAGAAGGFHSLLGRLPPESRDVGEMWQVFALPNGRAVFAGANTLYWWDGARFRLQQFPGARRISALRTPAGVYVHHLPTGLWQVEPDSQRAIVPADQLAGGAVLWVEEAGEGRRLLATSRGFLLAAAGRCRPMFAAASELVRQLGLTAALRLPDGRLAVSTLRGGIVLLAPSGDVSERLDRRSGLPTDEVFSLCSDREGGLWATSSANIFRVSLRGARWYRDWSGTGDQPCVAIAPTPRGLAFATDTGVYLADPGGDHIRPLADLRRHCWNLEAARGALLVARNAGLDRVGPEGVTPIYRSESDVVAVRFEARRQSAVLAAGRKVVRVAVRGDDPAVTLATLPDAAMALALGRGDEVWVGTTTQGIVRVGPPRPGTVAAAPANLPGNRGPGIVASGPDGVILAFVGRAGWRAGRGDTWLPIRGFPRRDVCAWEVGPAGAWIVHPAQDDSGACVAQIRDSAGGPRWVPWLIEGLGRVGIPECIHAEALAGRTRLWIGGTAGILRCDLIEGEAPPAIPAPLLALRSGDGGPLPPGGLPYSAGEWVLSAAAPSFALGPALTCETWIESVDRKWLPLDSGGTRRLFALRDGRYVIRARVRAASGETGPETRRMVTILPPWWRTGWMGLGVALGLSAGGYGLHRWKSGTLRRRADELERAVRGRTSEVEEANAEKTRFVAGISHDIRNPLNGIVGLTLALEDSALDARQRELTAAMRGCAKYLDGLVDEVIDFAQIESGRAVPRPEWYRTAELLEDVVAITRTDAEVAGARVRVETAAGVPARLWGDVGRVRQILVNLTFNAIKHAGGEIWLRAEAVAGGPESGVEYSVTDAGAGIAVEEQHRLFEPFSRIETPGPVRRVRGSGLGLATSKRSAELMGGRIRVVSSAGSGSRFTLAVPLGRDAPPEPPAVPPGALRRVLVVEDEDYNAWAIAAVAARVGVTVTARAATGAEALRLFAAGRFDGVILDRLLPDMDGTEVCRALRAAPGGDRLKIIALTAGATAEDRAACLAAGMDAFVGKPLTPEKLMGALGKLAGESEPGSPARADPVGVDLRLIRYLSDGTAEGLARELRRYLANLEDALQALRLAAMAADPGAIRECAHRLNGHFRMIDAAAAREAAAELERRAQRLELPTAGSLAELAAEAERLRAALTGWANAEAADDPRQTPAPGRSGGDRAST